MKPQRFFGATFVAWLSPAGIAAGQHASIILASTTSVENSGLLAQILPTFAKDIGGGRDAVAALRAIAAAAPFVSRDDRSGTDALEHRLWRIAAIDPAKAGGGSWYRDIGGGMGAALNTARAMGAYTIAIVAPG